MTPSNLKLLLGIGITLIAACSGDGGGDDDTIPTDPDLPAELRLELPAEHTPGTPLAVRWTITGDVAGTRVALRLVAPGAPVTPTSAGYRFTGSAPATGDAWWIASDGSLDGGEIATADPAAAAGEILVTLPSSAEGDWELDGLLLRGDQTVDAATATTWSATGTAVRLELGRTWAGLDTVVRAAVVVRGTSAAEPLRLSAWLTAPDGTVRSLPGLDDSQGYVEVVEGSITPGRFELLAQPLGGYGAGEHLVTVKLETLAGEVRGRAGAVVQVCAAAGTVAGAVAGGGDGHVLLIDPIDDQAFEAPIDGSGAFTIDVPAGRYVALARGAGWTAGAATEVGCGQTVDPSLTAIAGASARPRRPAASTPPPPPPPAPGGPAIAHDATSAQPLRIRVYHDTQNGNVSRVLANELSSAFERALTGNAGSLGGGAMTFVLDTEMMDLEAAAIRENMNVRGNQGASAALMDAVDYDFVIRLDLITTAEGDGDDDDRYSIRARVIDPTNLQVLVDAQQSATGSEAAAQAAADVARATLLANRAPVRPLRPLLASLAEFPENPVLAINLDKTTAAPGDTITATISLSEASPATPAGGIGVVGEWLPASGTVALETFPVVTGDAGTATFAFVVPATGVVDQQRLVFRAALVRASGTHVSPTRHAFVQLNGRGTMTLSTVAPVANGDQVGATVAITSGNVVGRQAQVTTVNALYEGPTTITLDAANRGSFAVTTVDSGPGKIAVVAPIASPFFGAPMPLTIQRAFYAVEPLAVTALIDPDTRILNGRVVAVKGVVLLEGAPYANAPVALTTAGGGFVVSGITTDANGAYQTLYVSPGSGSGTTAITATVVMDALKAQATASVTWGPSCGDCPLLVTPDVDGSIAKGATRVFVANQDVTWTATAGTITSDGVYTAPQAGGVVHITATSVMNPARTKLLRVVVDCTVAEATGDFGGAMTTSFGSPPPGPLSCATLILMARPQMIDGFQINLTYGCPGTSVFDGRIRYAQVSSGCAFISVETDFLACGTLQEIEINPNLDEPGNDSRRIEIMHAHPPVPSGGQCVLDYRSSGIARR